MQDRSAQEIWEATLGELQVQVSKQNYQTWLAKTVGISCQSNHFVVGVPNTFIAEYLDKKQRSLIEKTLIGLTNRDLNVLFQVNGYHQNSHQGDGFRETNTNSQQPNHKMLHARHTFGSFIVGDCNRLANAAAISIADNPGRSYNPLYIYGGVGLGKTHLLHAIGHTALAKHYKVLYVSAERFTNEFIAALHQRKSEEFHDKYRNVDILLIDDIQFICGKEQTEESFFHTFNELHNANRQIVITSDSPPKSLPLLHNRLRSRFEGGLIATVQPPALETRLAILRAKAEQQEVKIPPEALECIARQAEQNIRQLEGLLNRVIAYARLVRAGITPELTIKAIADIAGTPAAEMQVTPSQVIHAVAINFRLNPDDLKTRKRDREIALARQVAMYLIRQETDCSLAQIGQELGGRDHTTVIHACEKITRNLTDSSHLQRKVADIQRILSSEKKARKQ